MSEKRAIDIWREKLEFLRQQEAIGSDPSIKFQLLKQIEEAKAKIKDLESEEREARRSQGAPPAAPTSPKDLASGVSGSPQLKIVPVEELGGDQRQVMEWHRQIMQDSAFSDWGDNLSEKFPSLSKFKMSGMAPRPRISQWGGLRPKPIAGVMTRDELSDLIYWLEQRAPPLNLVKKKKRGEWGQIDQARNLLRKMVDAGVDAAEYVPAQLRGLPRHLIGRAIAILHSDFIAHIKGSPFEITQESLNRYRDSQRDTMAELRKSFSREFIDDQLDRIDREVQEIAQHLGFRV